MSAAFESGHFIPQLRDLVYEVPFNLEKSRKLSAYIFGLEVKGYNCSEREDKLWSELTWLIESTETCRAYYAQKVADFLEAK